MPDYIRITAFQADAFQVDAFQIFDEENKEDDFGGKPLVRLATGGQALNQPLFAGRSIALTTGGGKR